MKSIVEILDEIAVKSGSRSWLDCLQTCTSAHNNLLIEEAAEIYANQSKWISISDRLPEQLTEVMLLKEGSANKISFGY